MQPTDINNPDYFHKVVDCQWACPAHTPVPEYIRLIAERRYTDAFMVNWESNVFPGILGRTCDRPCEPACRRGRVEKEPVAICRLKRVAADNKGDIRPFLPQIPREKNGKRIALVGAGPASLTVARDLMPLGYHCVMFDGDAKGGGMMRSQIPRFRLPTTVTDEEVDLILDMGVETHFGEPVNSLRRYWPRVGTPFLSAAARRVGVISKFRAAPKRRLTFISASIGCRVCRLVTSTRSADASSCLVAATPRWIAAARRAGLAGMKSPSWCAAALMK